MNLQTFIFSKYNHPEWAYLGRVEAFERDEAIELAAARGILLLCEAGDGSLDDWSWPVEKGFVNLAMIDVETL